MAPTAAPSTDLNGRLYLLAVGILSLFCLWPIWSLEFPPLQDYPQHLFLAHVNATYDNPAYNWQKYYQATLTFGPYTFFYFFVAGFEKIVSITSAGKLFLSLYIGLMAGVAMAVRNTPLTNKAPWGSLLLFPLAFHQMYFMGFTNFLLSVPLLALAIIDHQRFTASPPTAVSFFRQLLWVTLLVLCHPFTILVYIGLAGASALLRPEANGPGRKIALIPPAATAGFFLIWYVQGLAGGQGKMPLLWWPWRETLVYYLLMFCGMRWTDGIHWPTLAGWLAALAIVLFGIINRLRIGAGFPKRAALAFALSTSGFFVLPFWAGQYSYFNLRLAPLSYLFAAILAGACALPRLAGLGLAAVCAFLISQSAVLQAAVSRETAEIKPIVARMEANAALLPMTFQTESSILDRHFFPEAHSHDYFYYHLLVGGGVSPSLFPSPMLPLQLKPGLDLPLATHDFSWADHGSKYDYILTRGAPAEFPPFVSRYAPIVGQSGSWLLFKNEHKK